MAAIAVEEPPAIKPRCAHCGSVLIRNRYERLETFRKREFCDDDCAARAGVGILNNGTQTCICGFISHTFPCYLCQMEGLEYTPPPRQPKGEEDAWDGESYPAKRRKRIHDNDAVINFKLAWYCIKYDTNEQGKSLQVPMLDPKRSTDDGEFVKETKLTWLDNVMERIKNDGSE